MAAGGAVEKTYGRARFTSHSTSDRLPATKPPTLPSALLSVPIADVNPVLDAQVFGHAPAVAAENAGGVGLVHQQHRLVPLGQVGQFGQRRQVAVHAEQAVGDDQPPAVLSPTCRADRANCRQSSCG